MAQTGDILGPAIQAFLQGQQISRNRSSNRIAERRLELAEEQHKLRTGTAQKKAEREAEDTSLLNQLLQGIFPALQGGGAPQPQAATPLQPTAAPQDPFAEFSFTPADEAAATQRGGQEALEVLRNSIEAQRQGGAIEPSLEGLLPEVQQQAEGIPLTGPSAISQEQARQQIDLNTPDRNFTVTVGGRSVQVSNLKGTPEQKFKRLLAAAKKDAKAQGIDFDIAEFKKIFGDSVLPEAGEVFFKRAFRDETTKAIAEKQKAARAAKPKGAKSLSKEESLQIKREVFDDAIVRFGGLPEGVTAPEGLESLERTAQVSEAQAFGQELGTGAAKAEGPILLTSELAKLEANANAIPQDISKQTSLQSRTMLETTKNDKRTPVADKFLFAARAAGLGKDVLQKIQKRDFANITQEDIQALMAELVKTDSLTALFQQIFGPQAGGTTTTQTPEEKQSRRDELRRKRDAK